MMARVFPFALIAGLAGCLAGAPNYGDKECVPNDEKPCPEGAVCFSDLKCHTICASTAQCSDMGQGCVRNSSLEPVPDGELGSCWDYVVTCSSNEDCVEGFYCASADGVCHRYPMNPTCADDVKDGQETGVDCGGPECRPCEPGEACSAPEDCASRMCTNGFCRGADCYDDVQNGEESAVDCGGGCTGCPAEQSCFHDEDCESDVCTDGSCVAASCDDSTANGGESDADCGGETECRRCYPSERCDDDSDCESNVCTDLRCQPARCDDETQNGGESDEDCGGDTECRRCDPEERCTEDSDCESDVCLDGTCLEVACDDEVKNGDESDEDCGGSAPACRRCEQTRNATARRNCASKRLCATSGLRRVCIPADCDDHVQNGDEERHRLRWTAVPRLRSRMALRRSGRLREPRLHRSSLRHVRVRRRGAKRSRDRHRLRRGRVRPVPRRRFLPRGQRLQKRLPR